MRWLILLLPCLLLADTVEKVCVIVNPIAGGMKKNEIVRKIVEELSHDAVEIVYTNGSGHATQLAREALGRGVSTLVVIGGDGTVNEVSQAMVGSDARLAIIPCGSGNGLAHHLNIPFQVDQSIQLLKTGHTATIDTVQINDRYYLCVAGIGFDAEVGWAFSEYGQRGFLSYLLLALKKLPAYEPKKYSLSIDGKTVSRKAFLIAFANSSQFGNDAYIAPTAEINDGYLDVIIMKAVPFYATARVVHQLFTKSLDTSRYVEIIKCKTIDITEPNLKAHVDGEPVLFPEGMHLKVVPSSLKVVVP